MLFWSLNGKQEGRPGIIAASNQKRGTGWRRSIKRCVSHAASDPVPADGSRISSVLESFKIFVIKNLMLGEVLNFWS
jgi:hypothetical protein